MSNTVVKPFEFYCAEPSFTARLVSAWDPEEATLFYRLRYDYFVTHRRWVSSDSGQTKCEIDQYDAMSYHLGIWQGNQPVAYLRALPWHQHIGFMLDHEFRCLLSDDEHASLHRKNAVELSRLVMAPGACTRDLLHNGNGERQSHVVELLLKLLYHLSLEQQIEHYYIVVEKHWLPAFTRRFHIPFKVIGREYTFPDGTVTVAAYATRIELEQAVAAKDLQKFLWYQQRGPAVGGADVGE